MFDLRSAICDVCKRRAILLLLVASTVAPLTATVAAAQATDPSQQQFLFAYKLLQRGEDGLAAEAFDEYIAGYPTAEQRGDAMYYRALLLRRAGDAQAALDRLKDAPKPKLVPAYALDLLRGQALSDLGKHKEAAAAFDQIDTAKLKPATAASVLYLRGRAHRGANNLAAAARDFAAAAKPDSPVRPRALIDLSTTQSAMGNDQDAVKTLQRVLALDDTTAPAEAARLAGDLSYQTGEYDAAIEFYSMVIAGHPASPHFGPSVVGKLWAQYSAGLDRDVLATYDEHRKALPVQDRPQAVYLAGSSAQRLGNHKAAADALASITQTDTPYPLLDKALLKLAESQLALDQYDAMRASIGKLTRLYPDSPLRADAAFLLATADAEQGNAQRGAARLTELIEHGPQHPYHTQSLLRRARLYEANGEPAAAIADYRAYLKAQKSITAQRNQVQTHLIRLLAESGDHAGAIAAADRVIANDKLGAAGRPLRLEAMYRRAVALIETDKPGDALQQLDALDKTEPLHPYRDAATYYRGLILVAQGKAKDAEKPLSEAGNNEKLDAASRINAYRVLAAARRDREDANGSAAALAALEKLGGRDAMVGSELVWLGRYFNDAGDAKRAKAYLDTALQRRAKLDPKLLAAALYEAGRMHRQSKAFEPALLSFEEVLALGKGLELDAQLEMARTFAAMGQREAAIDLFKGLAVSDDSRIAATALAEGAATWQALADTHRRADDPAAADAALREARKLLKRIVLLFAMPRLEPLPQEALLQLADIADQLDEPQQRAKELDELIRKYPDGPHARYAKALQAAQRNRIGEARTLLKQLKDQPMDAALSRRVDAALKALEG